jgi:peroxiredoxin
VRDHIEDYRGAGVTVWGVTGHYPQLIAPWDKEHAFGVPILADYDHVVCTTYVGLYERPAAGSLDLLGVTRRCSVPPNAASGGAPPALRPAGGPAS